MSDLAIGACSATDLFLLGGDFEAQSSTTTHTDDTIEAFKNNGDPACTTEGVNGRTDYSCEYIYCGTTFVTDIHAALLTSFGSIKDSKAVTDVTITYATGQYISVSVSGHNHDENAHESGFLDTFDANDILISPDGDINPGVYDFFTLANAATCVTTASLSFSIDHDDIECGSGDHGAGLNLRARATGTIEYVGDVNINDVDAAWTVTTNEVNDQNSGFCTESITAFQNLTKN
jgi:hypothetical protein